MKVFFFILFTTVPSICFGQSATEHYDSIINGQLGKHKCQYNDDVCYTNIEYAKKVLANKKNPTVIIQSSFYGEPNYCYESELRAICKKKNIDIEDLFGLCGSEIMYRTCYYAYLKKDIEDRYYKGITDSLHLWACQKYIQENPEDIVYTIHPSFNNPISTSKKRKYPFDLDTLYIPKSEINIKKTFDKEFGLSRLITLSVFIDASGNPKIESISFDLEESYSMKSEMKNTLKNFARDHFTQNYNEWLPATFSGSKVPTRIYFKYSALNKN